MTKITDAYRQWSELWRDFPTDEEEEAAGEARSPLEDLIADEPATCLEDVVCKLKLSREIDGWLRQGEVLADAIGAIELARQPSDYIDPAIALFQCWWELRRQFDEMPETPETEKERDRLAEGWVNASRTLSRTTAVTLRGVIGKLRVLAAEMEAGPATDKRDIALAQTARQDLERISGRGNSA
jgi:hypothetical protein